MGSPDNNVKPTDTLWVNGKPANPQRPTVSGLARGVWYGEGVFETMRAYGGVVFRLQQHVDRLLAGARVLSLGSARTADEIGNAVRGAVAASGLCEAYVRLMLIGSLREGASGDLLVVVRQLEPYPSQLYQQGAKMATASIRRNESSPLCRIKSMNYLDNLLALREARSRGADECLFLNSRGRITEGATSNLFCLLDHGWATPPESSGLLPGITRQAVLEISRQQGLAIHEEELDLADLRAAREIFITSSLKEVMPVVELDGHTIGRGRPGPQTLRFRKGFQAKVLAETRS